MTILHWGPMGAGLIFYIYILDRGSDNSEKKKECGWAKVGVGVKLRDDQPLHMS